MLLRGSHERYGKEKVIKVGGKKVRLVSEEEEREIEPRRCKRTKREY